MGIVSRGGSAPIVHNVRRLYFLTYYPGAKRCTTLEIKSKSYTQPTGRILRSSGTQVRYRHKSVAHKPTARVTTHRYATLIGGLQPVFAPHCCDQGPLSFMKAIYYRYMSRRYCDIVRRARCKWMTYGCIRTLAHYPPEMYV